MKRDLFVFAGQSNMMGAAVLPPKRELRIENSFEYKHKLRRLGKTDTPFVKAGYPVGEFSYIDLEKAYGEDMTDEKGRSKLCDYTKNTYFCPSMSNLKSEESREVSFFSSFSESTAKASPTLAPFIAEEWEKLGGACAYAHIAKGAISIDYYFTDEMTLEYKARMTEHNRKSGENYKTEILDSRRISGAAEYFAEKCRNFFADAEKRFSGDDLSDKCFFWLQGEGDVALSSTEYEMKLDILWEQIKTLGFTHFFCIRIDYFGSHGIYKVMRAQEDFVSKHPDAYMLTRAASYLTYPGQNEDEWFISPPSKEYRECRDSYYGYTNHHINERGFSVIAKHAITNLQRVLMLKEEPVLEAENIKVLKQWPR